MSEDVKSTAPDGASTTKTAGTTASASTMRIEMFAIIALGLVVAGILLRVAIKNSVMKIFPARRRGITTDRHDFDRIDDLAHEWHEGQVVDDALSNFLKLSKIPATSDFKPRRAARAGDDREEITRARDSVISMREHRQIDAKSRQSEWSNAQPQHKSVSIDPEPESIDNRHQNERSNDQRQHGSVTDVDELLHDLQSSLITAPSEYRLPPSRQVDDGCLNNGRGKDGPSQISHEIREREEVLDRLRHDLDRLLQSPKMA